VSGIPAIQNPAPVFITLTSCIGLKRKSSFHFHKIAQFRYLTIFCKNLLFNEKCSPVLHNFLQKSCGKRKSFAVTNILYKSAKVSCIKLFSQKFPLFLQVATSFVLFVVNLRKSQDMLVFRENFRIIRKQFAKMCFCENAYRKSFVSTSVWHPCSDTFAWCRSQPRHSSELHIWAVGAYLFNRTLHHI
jgi:hypothetical protein